MGFYRDILADLWPVVSKKYELSGRKLDDMYRRLRDQANLENNKTAPRENGVAPSSNMASVQQQS